MFRVAKGISQTDPDQHESAGYGGLESFLENFKACNPGSISAFDAPLNASTGKKEFKFAFLMPGVLARASLLSKIRYYII